MKPINNGLIFLLVISLVGCAKTLVQADADPSFDPKNFDTMYVRKLPADDRGIERIIARQLNEFGFEATHGASHTPPDPVDAVVTYQDRWMWDITMYMLELDIQIRHPKTDYIIAAGHSYRTSLVRKSPHYMVDEVLRQIFAGKIELPEKKLRDGE